LSRLLARNALCAHSGEGCGNNIPGGAAMKKKTRLEKTENAHAGRSNHELLAAIPGSMN